ncbi:DUF2789 domain-containing protein [Acidovorax sp. Leaf78]|uniref:DUF2789 domain-containing protein n=1 Tax=unclassified Acidovorax TaxID=2684926 RepID=UPI0006FEA791|nr:DUF2789 domain-containing protein [Acidovorax sp. Leaf78]KQO23318.1 hypothetical protein ASF16_03825 [Acidovorax sp. Leaf78]RZJ59299.1 MAG: DUF2789 domain-containing protein [Acidovorax sp.]
MITTEPTMTNLFLQLGLDESEQGIADFIKSHQLPTEVALGEAEYWSDAQRQFLVEQLKADAPWAMIVDQLSEALHSDAVKRSTGL